MYSTKILDDYEYETFNVFSTKLNPNTKHDYLSKVTIYRLNMRNQLVKRYIVIYIVFITS